MARVFNPFGTAKDKDGRVFACVFRCARPGCKGAMFDVTTALVEAMGVKHYECDMCHERRGMRAPSLRGKQP